MEAVVARPPFQRAVVAGILHTGRDSLKGILTDAAHVVLLVVATGPAELVGPRGRSADVPAPPRHAVEPLDGDLELGQGLLLGTLAGRCRPRPHALAGPLGRAGLRWVWRGGFLRGAAAIFGIDHLDVVIEGKRRLPLPRGPGHALCLCINKICAKGQIPLGSVRLFKSNSEERIPARAEHPCLPE